jgi:hypothetical protein
MTNPAPAPVIRPAWLATATPPPPAAQPVVSWGAEIVMAVLVSAYSVLAGGVVGLIWPRVAPHVQIKRAALGSEAASKALLGDDLWLALLGICAAAACAAVLAVSAREAGRGPGGVVGLAVGGLLGSLVAVHIGHIVRHPQLQAEVHTSFPRLNSAEIARVLGYFDFTLRAKALLLAWPIAGVVLQAAVVVLRFMRHGEGSD